jgi:cholesterol transport system auxiliary component
MRPIFFLLTSLMLAACVGNPPRQTAIALHDLGEVGGPGVGSVLPVATLEVQANSWLDSTAQLYRLSYADPLRRHAYTESRWVAPPAELIERLLMRRVAFGPDPTAAGCRLRLMIDEFEQRFDAPQASRVVLDVRVQLLSPRNDTPLGLQLFRIDRPAPSADARGGVQAARLAGEALAGELVDWLAGLARDRPALVAACR